MVYSHICGAVNGSKMANAFDIAIFTGSNDPIPKVGLPPYFNAITFLFERQLPAFVFKYQGIICIIEALAFLFQ